MSTPRIEIDLGKIAHNVSRLMELYGSRGIDISAVTKVVCGNPDIAEVLVKTGIDILADSRIANIIKMRDAGIEAQFLLLRTPFLSQAEAVVNYADLSLNSDLSVIRELSRFALMQHIKHRNRSQSGLLWRDQTGQRQNGTVVPDR
jgi:predicted amino acid racemase